MKCDVICRIKGAVVGPDFPNDEDLSSELFSCFCCSESFKLSKGDELVGFFLPEKGIISSDRFKDNDDPILLSCIGVLDATGALTGEIISPHDACDKLSNDAAFCLMLSDALEEACSKNITFFGFPRTVDVFFNYSS